MSKDELYDMGQLYKFKDFGAEKWTVGKLVDVRDRCFQVIVRRRIEEFEQIEEIAANELGNIVQAPVELEPGHAYQFTRRGTMYHGVFDEEKHTFKTRLLNVPVSKCEDIVELLPNEQ